MKNSLFITLSALCFALNLQAQSVCNYKVDCQDTEINPDCECYDQPTGYIVALQDGDLRVKVNMLPEPYFCCGETFSGSIAFSAHKTNGWPLLSGAGDHLIPCVAKGDTVLFGFSGKSGSYTISNSIENIPQFGLDEEPNNNQSEAIDLSPGTAEGRVGHGIYNRDKEDVYKIEVPEDGNLILEVEVDYGGSMAVFGTNSPWSIADDSSNEADVLKFRHDCVEAGDVFYLSMNTLGPTPCYGYKINYRIERPQAANDKEPNDNHDIALDLSFEDVMEGHIGFGNYSRDNSDAYWVTCPQDGLLEIGATFEHGGNLVLWALGNPWNINGANTTEDGATIYMREDCVKAGDRFKLVVSPTHRCSGYKVWGNMISEPLTEIEPNDQFTDAIPLSPGALVKGGLGNGYYQKDFADVYRVKASGEGVIDVEVVFETGGRVQYFDSEESLLHSEDVGADESLFLSTQCIAADDFVYIKLIRNNNSCGAYELRIEKKVIEASEISLCETPSILLDGGALGPGEASWSTCEGNILQGEDGFIAEVDRPGLYILKVWDEERACMQTRAVVISEDDLACERGTSFRSF